MAEGVREGVRAHAVHVRMRCTRAARAHAGVQRVRVRECGACACAFMHVAHAHCATHRRQLHMCVCVRVHAPHARTHVYWRSHTFVQHCEQVQVACMHVRGGGAEHLLEGIL